MSRGSNSGGLVKCVVRRSARFATVSSRYAVAAIALAAGLTASVATADVLKYTPKDSLGVFRVKNVGELSKKVSDFATKIGAAGLQPKLADPLGAMKEELGIKDGIREDGEFGVVLLPASMWPKEGAEDKPGLVILVPVSDYAKFVANFPDAKTEGGITEFQHEGNASFVANWGEYAAVSPAKEHLASKPEGITLNAAAAKEFATKDAVLWANIPAMKAVFGPKLAENREKWLSEAEEGIKGSAEMAKYAGVIKVAAGRMIDAGDTFLSNANGATLSFSVNEAGITSSVSAEFAPDSYLGKFVTALGGSNSSFTAGLPKTAYLIYGGFSGNGATISGLFKDIAGPIMKELSAVEGSNATEVQKTIDSMDKLLTSAKSTNFGMLAPKGQLGVESMIQIAYVLKGDAKAYQSAMKDYGESYSKLMSAFGAGAMPMNMEYKTAAKTVDGVSFDVLQMVQNPNPKTPQEAQMAQMMGMMYGPAGFAYNIAAIDDATGVMTLGLADPQISTLIASAKAGTDEIGGQAHVQSTAKQLPEKSIGVMYIALDEFVRTGVNIARNFGMGANFDLPPNLPPIGSAMAADGSVLKVDTHVPTELVQSLVAAYLQMMQQQGGGPGGL